MAQQELTGATQTELEEMRDEYETMPSAAEYYIRGNVLPH